MARLLLRKRLDEMHLSNGTYCPPTRTRVQLGTMDWLKARKEEQRDNSTIESEALSQTTAVSSSTKSRLLSLPPELRNAVYTALFAPGEVERIKPGYTIPPFLLTCKQVYAEATGVYYSHSIFRCLEEDSAVSWLTHLPRKWLDRIQEIRYDTRWIIFVTPFIPVPGAERWLFQNLVSDWIVRFIFWALWLLTEVLPFCLGEKVK